jgi:hypothetical protein
VQWAKQWVFAGILKYINLSIHHQASHTYARTHANVYVPDVLMNYYYIYSKVPNPKDLRRFSGSE